MSRLRVLVDSAGEGAWNMAVDEALLQSAAVQRQATLRFYGWQQATLSLGYFQAAEDRDLHAASRACPLVRRSSGGGAILHDRELTYSLAMPNQPTAAAARWLYELVHGSLIDVLAELGARAVLFQNLRTCAASERPAVEPFLCFQRRTCFDVIAGESKIAGSAQRRRGRAVLQHGSILLAASPCAPELPGLKETTRVDLSFEQLASAWAGRIAQALGLIGEPATFTEAEQRLSQDIARERFASADFTQRR